MSRQDSVTPMVKRSIRTIQSELEFLADADYLTQQQLQMILGQLPSGSNLQPPPPQSASQPPTQAFSNLNVSNDNTSEKQGFYHPSPSPAPNVQPPPPEHPMAPPAPADALTHASALYAYTPTDLYDLEFVTGDRVAVTEFMNEEWWKGRNERTGKEGIFPRNYVKVEEKLPMQSKETNYGNVPVQVANGYANTDSIGPHAPTKTQEYSKKFGRKLGNAAIFGAGASIGSNIVNGIL